MKVIIAKNQNDIDLCLKVRRTVFIEEQSVPEELEIDEFDTDTAQCTHLMIYDEDNLMGTFRVISEKQNEAHLQRLCILKEYRGRDFGKYALQCADAFCLSNGYSRITLNSQCHAIKFYEKSTPYFPDSLRHRLIRPEHARPAHTSTSGMARRQFRLEQK